MDIEKIDLVAEGTASFLARASEVKQPARHKLTGGPVYECGASEWGWGIRNNHGLVCKVYRPTRFMGQDERFARETEEFRSVVEFIISSLNGANAQPAQPVELTRESLERDFGGCFVRDILDKIFSRILSDRAATEARVRAECDAHCGEVIAVLEKEHGDEMEIRSREVTEALDDRNEAQQLVEISRTTIADLERKIEHLEITKEEVTASVETGLILELRASETEPKPWEAVLIDPEDPDWDAWEIWEGDKCISTMVMGSQAAKTFVEEHNRWITMGTSEEG